MLDRVLRYSWLPGRKNACSRESTSAAPLRPPPCVNTNSSRPSNPRSFQNFHDLNPIFTTLVQLFTTLIQLFTTLVQLSTTKCQFQFRPGSRPVWKYKTGRPLLSLLANFSSKISNFDSKLSEFDSEFSEFDSKISKFDSKFSDLCPPVFRLARGARAHVEKPPRVPQPAFRLYAHSSFPVANCSRARKSHFCEFDCDECVFFAQDRELASKENSKSLSPRATRASG